MDDKYILVEYQSTLNNVITQTFKDMQRVKLTCFDVSSNFIFFGASSGGIYIFKREPCEFLKLIPSKEGSAKKILCSPSERNVAIASAKGLVIILQDIFNDMGIDYQIYSEHEGNSIVTMKWHGTDLFCGDNTGKVSVVTLMNKLSKAIFQTPSASLMTLDSTVVQIDAYMNYLLVSTRTRTYLCDTEKEHYKQIGKKLRDGDFGACFFNINSFPEYCSTNIRGVYRTINEDETFGMNIQNDIKIFCARPGARLWEVNLCGTVMVTYQFKNSLNKHPSELLQIKDDLEEDFHIKSFKCEEYVPSNFNFGKIYPICNRFILTYNYEGIYVFDPLSSELVFWSNDFKGIKDIVLLHSFVYIWQEGLRVQVISVLLLEELILKTLFKKQFYLCAKICVNYLEDVLSLLGKSNKMHLVSILKSKIDDNELYEKIMPILNVIEDSSNKANHKKLQNGIIVVANGIDHDNSLEFMQHPNGVYTDKGAEAVVRSEINILYKQFKLNKTHRHVEIPDTKRVLSSLKLNEIFLIFEEFKEYVQTKFKEDASLWCKEQFLRQCSLKDNEIKDLSTDYFKYLEDIFLELENYEHDACCCGFPLPRAHKHSSKYYSLGCKLLEMTSNSKAYLKTVPYLYKYRLMNVDVASHIPLVVQFGDITVLQNSCSNFTYDMWDETLKLTIKLKNGLCLNCDKNIETDGAITWNNLGLIIIKSVGPSNATKLLTRYSQHIPKGEISMKFYQACVFASLVDCDESDSIYSSVDFIENADRVSSRKFSQLMEKYLQKKYLGNNNSTTTLINKTRSSLETKCSFCDLSLDIPILNETIKAQCGHSFHMLCFNKNSNICNICI